MWYTTTELAGVHWGIGKRTADIPLEESVHVMQCWWLCFLCYSSTITFAKLSLGFFFLRIGSTVGKYRIGIIVITGSAVLTGISYFFLSLFQCMPVDFFWKRLEGAVGKCISIDVIVVATYWYGAVTVATDIGFGILVATLIWNLKVELKAKLLVAPMLGLACVASYAALVRMPYVEGFRSDDFLFNTVDLALWFTIEVGVSIFAANLATLRPLVRHVGTQARELTSRMSRGNTTEAVQTEVPSTEELTSVEHSGKRKMSVRVVELPSDRAARLQNDTESTISLTRSTHQTEY
ncbi:hypothetical protein E8E13_000684 [Curvularia kusanoi]|uniref:Rhodopsin domain-containing protein n=1 Tax=Curvularia kusanoi TaxID=90978 RepID=A0A9P4T359_CURKU|nr:hypothetical protein E8E13_000684 [Curvularia kusanoi]